jgi:hypothetical protein
VSTFTPAVLSLDQDSRYADDEADALLAGSAEELGRLRFTIILIARWEQSNSLTPQRRKTFSEELGKLRALYLGMLDELGMAFGVQQATKTQEQVERTVSVPQGMLPPSNPCFKRYCSESTLPTSLFPLRSTRRGV